jgi:hypothetical protein
MAAMVGILAIMRMGGDLALLRIGDVGGVVIEGRQRADRHATITAIGCASRRKPGEEPAHLLVHHGVVA